MKRLLIWSIPAVILIGGVATNYAADLSASKVRIFVKDDNSVCFIRSGSLLIDAPCSGCYSNYVGQVSDTPRGYPFQSTYTNKCGDQAAKQWAFVLNDAIWTALATTSILAIRKKYKNKK